VLKSVELTVYCHLVECHNVILQVEPFGFQSLAPPWVLIQPRETLALLVEKGSDVCLIVLVLVVLRYIPAEVTPSVNVSKALLNGSDQIPSPFQAALEGRKTTRKAFAKDRHQKSHPTPFFRWQVGKPIETPA
jgi:hypothetical protein